MNLMKTVFFDRERSSDSPFVEKVWSSHSEVGARFISAAESRWEIVIEKRAGKTTLYVRGPESRASSATAHRMPNGSGSGSDLIPICEAYRQGALSTRP